MIAEENCCPGQGDLSCNSTERLLMEPPLSSHRTVFNGNGPANTFPTRLEQFQDESDSEFSEKELEIWEEIPKGSFIIFDTSSNGLIIGQSPEDLMGNDSNSVYTSHKANIFQDSNYIKVELPTFHFWSDTLHIYFDKSVGATVLSKYKTQSRVRIYKKKLDDALAGDLMFVRTIKLGRLGMGIKARRIFRKLNFIYILLPGAQQPHYITRNAMQTHHEAETRRRRISVNSASPLRFGSPTRLSRRRASPS